jgi:rare lipoprotein A (peptidoglycan hydrolase)
MKRLFFAIFCATIVLVQISAQARLGDFTMRGAATQDIRAEGFVAAHPSLPLNSRVIITNPRNGREIEVTIIDRIDPSLNRIVDLSPAAVQALGMRAGEVIILTVPAPPRPVTQVSRREVPIVELPETVAANQIENEQVPSREPQVTVEAQEPLALIEQQPIVSTEQQAAIEQAVINNQTENIIHEQINVVSINEQESTPEASTRQPDNQANQPAVNENVNRTATAVSVNEPLPAAGIRAASNDTEFLAWLMAMSIDAREAREIREAREAREAREVREAREAREVQEARDLRETREARALREAREIQEARDIRNAREARETREAQQAIDTRTARTVQDRGGQRPGTAQENRTQTDNSDAVRAELEARLAQEIRTAQEARDALEALLAQEARAAQETRETLEARLAQEARAAQEAREALEARTQAVSVQEAAPANPPAPSVPVAAVSQRAEGALEVQSQQGLMSPSPAEQVSIPVRTALPPQVSPAPVSPENIQIIPGLPDRNSRKIYRLQIGAFSNLNAANIAAELVQRAGFDVEKELAGTMYRVLVIGISSVDVYPAAVRLGSLGFGQIWVRE